MLNRIVRVTPQPNYRLEVEFEDGVSGIIDLSGDLEGEIFEPLSDESFFSRVSIDEYGAISWPNGADLAPDALYIEITGKSRCNNEPEQRQAASAEAEPRS